MGSSAVWGLAASVFVAAIVEMVEALTIVLAMGMTRSWRSTVWGIVSALIALTAFTAVAGYALVNWLPEAALQLTVGALLLIFGMQWVRKAVLRSSGRKALHDEAKIFKEQETAARTAGDTMRLGLDWFSFVVTFKGVFLEGVEVVFIVITFGLNAKNMPVAVVSALAAAVVVLAAALVVHAPLTRVPENTLKYCVGLLLTTFGTFWSIEGLGIFRHGHESITWPGKDLILLALLPAWAIVARAWVVILRVPSDAPKGSPPPQRISKGLSA